MNRWKQKSASDLEIVYVEVDSNGTETGAARYEYADGRVVVVGVPTRKRRIHVPAWAYGLAAGSALVAADAVYHLVK